LLEKFLREELAHDRPGNFGRPHRIDLAKRATLPERTVARVVDACRVAGVPAIAVLGRDEVYTTEALVDAGCWLVVDDDDLGEVRVMREYSRWDGVPPRSRAHMRGADSDTERVLTEVTGLRRNESSADSSRAV